MANRVAVIINPVSGTGGRMEVARARAERAAALVACHGLDADVFITERPGHARELARASLARGISVVVAWGGDGTVNEVASALAYRDATLAIVPSGSGNGLARELRIPFNPDRAFAVALSGQEYRIDAGELDQRLFFNIAGVGLDARVAHRFAAKLRVRRGFTRYAAMTAHELMTYKPEDHTVVTDGITTHARPLLIAIANARQYGNGAMIAPGARLDDGRLDVVVVEDRPLVWAIAQIPRLFLGTIARMPGVITRTAVDIQITCAHPLLYHVDGEPFVGGAAIAARPRPGALRVAVPVASEQVGAGIFETTPAP